MVTSAITAAIGAVLSFLGVPPGPYLGVIWIAVKILIVLCGVLMGARALRRRKGAPALLQVPISEDRLSRR